MKGAGNHWNDTTCLLQLDSRKREDAFRVLFDRYHARMRNRLEYRWKLERAEAEDIAQDVFVALLQKPPALKSGQASLWPWLQTVLENRAKDFLKKAKTRPNGQSDGPAPRREAGNAYDAASDPYTPKADPATQPENLLQREQRTHCLEQAFDHFADKAPTCAQMLYQIAINGWKPRELATHLKRTPGAIRQALHDCRQRWRKLAARHCPEPADET